LDEIFERNDLWHIFRGCFVEVILPADYVVATILVVLVAKKAACHDLKLDCPTLLLLVQYGGVRKRCTDPYDVWKTEVAMK
jgi:hypothetical protein